MRTGGAVLVLAAAVLGLWRYGVQRRQRRTLVWALAAAIGEMESAIRWQQTPMMALLEGLIAPDLGRSATCAPPICSIGDALCSDACH